MFWISFVIHQALGAYGYLPVDPGIPNYEQEKYYQKLRDFFWVAGDYFLLTYALTCLNINYRFMGTTHLLWVLYDVGRVNYRFNPALMDYLLLACASVPAVISQNYNREMFSKLYFLQQKKI